MATNTGVASKGNKTAEAPKSPVDSWNKVFALLAEAAEAWEEHRQVLADWPDSLEKLPEEAQRFLSYATNKSTFEVMLDRMIRVSRNHGGLLGMQIGVKK